MHAAAGRRRPSRSRSGRPWPPTAAGIADGQLELDDGVVLAGAGADRAHQEFEPGAAADRLGARRRAPRRRRSSASTTSASSTSRLGSVARPRRPTKARQRRPAPARPERRGRSSAPARRLAPHSHRLLIIGLFVIAVVGAAAAAEGEESERGRRSKPAPIRIQGRIEPPPVSSGPRAAFIGDRAGRLDRQRRPPARRSRRPELPDGAPATGAGAAAGAGAPGGRRAAGPPARGRCGARRGGASGARAGSLGAGAPERRDRRRDGCAEHRRRRGGGGGGGRPTGGGGAIVTGALARTQGRWGGRSTRKARGSRCEGCFVCVS